MQARSQAEAMNPGLQHHMGLNVKKTLALLLAKNKSADQPAHPLSLISTFVFFYLKVSNDSQNVFGGLQHDKTSGYGPDCTQIHF